MRDRRAGFVDVELMIVVALSGVGAALSIPQLVKLQQHQPLSWWNWTCLVVGGGLVLLGVGTVAKQSLELFLQSRKRR